MLQTAFAYLLDILKGWPRARPALVRLRLVRRRLRRLLKAHPAISVLALVAVAGLLLIGPVIKLLEFEPKCHVIETDRNELYSPSGDSLTYGAARPCEHGQA